MITCEIEPIRWKSDSNYQLIHCKINLITENDAQIPLYNVSSYQGMLYDTIENFDANTSYKYHKSWNIKPWSFSLLKMRSYEKTSRRGIYSVKKGTYGYWILNTIDQQIFEAFLKANKQGSVLHLNNLQLKITSIEYEDKTYQAFPEDDFKTVTIQLHTPAYFYRVKNKEMFEFTEDSFLNFQLRKLQSLGIIDDFDIKEIRPNLRILRDDTTKKYISITIGGQTVRAYGSIGFVTFKLSGDAQIRRDLWELIHMSQFTGIGTRSSMGFGHNSIVSIK